MTYTTRKPTEQLIRSNAEVADQLIKARAQLGARLITLSHSDLSGTFGYRLHDIRKGVIEDIRNISFVLDQIAYVEIEVEDD